MARIRPSSRHSPGHGAKLRVLPETRLRPRLCDCCAAAAPMFGIPHQRLGTAWLCRVCLLLNPDSMTMRAGLADTARRLALDEE
jgi:hypothetical protein